MTPRTVAYLVYLGSMIVVAILAAVFRADGLLTRRAIVALYLALWVILSALWWWVDALLI